MTSNAIQLGVFLFLTALVALATWWRVRHEKRDTTDSSHDFFLAGGTLSWPFIAGSLLVLAHVLVPMYYKYKCTTTTELLERRLGDASLRRTVSVLFLLGYMFILLPMVLYTGSRFMKSMFQPDKSILAIAILFALAGL